jgi:hypothetical protein
MHEIAQKFAGETVLVLTGCPLPTHFSFPDRSTTRSKVSSPEIVIEAATQSSVQLQFF